MSVVYLEKLRNYIPTLLIGDGTQNRHHAVSSTTVSVTVVGKLISDYRDLKRATYITNSFVRQGPEME